MAGLNGEPLMTGTPAPAAALAIEHPPSAFQAFALRPLRPLPGPDRLLTTYYGVACKACGHAAFHIGSHAVTAPSPSPNPDYAPGEVMPGPPHRLKCARCGRADVAFDPRKHGYDGVLCGGAPYAVGETESFTPTAFKVYLAATYNIHLDELKELAAGAGGDVKPQDLFDWVNIEAKTIDGEGEPFEILYECA